VSRGATGGETVSAIVAVFDGERFIGDALGSILGQTRPPAEVCVIDDGSTDGTPAVVAAFRGVRVLRQAARSGQAAALNLGVASTSGDRLAFLDADDVWEADKLRRQGEALDADPALDVVYGHMRERVIGAGAPAAVAARDGGVLPAHLPSAMLIRRAAFERVGGFDTRFTLGSVVDWYARACEAGLRQLTLPEVVYERRIHGANTGIRQARHRADYLQVVKAALDRRRAAAARKPGP
jgi:glycosyltransferase involved in cell wall biosynthesis